jgi:hypothetical protein
MKHLFLLIGIFAALNLVAQEEQVTEPTKQPNFYLGTSTGINNFNGLLGITSEIRLKGTTFLRAGTGIGGWGTKYSIGLRRENKMTSGWGFGLSYSMANGLKNFETELELESGSTEKVTLDLLGASCVNLTTGYNVVFGNGNKFYVEFGFGVKIEDEPYKVQNDKKLSDNGKAVLKVMQPGGIILGIGFLFGL